MWKDYLSINNAHSATDSLLDKYRVNTLIVCKRTQLGLVDRVARMAAWETVFEDEVGFIAVRKRAMVPDKQDEIEVDEATVLRGN